MIIIAIAIIIWKNRSSQTSPPEKNGTDPAEYVLNNSVPDDEILDTLISADKELIFLKVGNEFWGFRHILKRHSGEYFKEHYPKGTLFPDNTNGKQIIEAMKKVFSIGKKGISNKQGNQVLIADIEVNNNKSEYRLVYSVDKKSVTTFFRVD